MSGECNKCSEHCLECTCEPLCRSQQNSCDIIVDKYELLDLIYFARRYSDGSATCAASHFNKIYKKIINKYPCLPNDDEFDITLKDKGAYWPYAQDGMYNEKMEVMTQEVDSRMNL